MSIQERTRKETAPPPFHSELREDISTQVPADEKGEQPTYIDHEGRFIEKTPAEHRKLMWKIDIHVIPWIAILYFLAFLDRVNIGNARLFGLEADTGLTGNQYNIALLLFFVPYILFEVPSNLILKRMKPRIWLPSTRMSWGSNRSAYVGLGIGDYVDGMGSESWRVDCL